jgi:hypothetical protein
MHEFVEQTKKKRLSAMSACLTFLSKHRSTFHCYEDVLLERHIYTGSLFTTPYLFIL